MRLAAVQKEMQKSISKLTNSVENNLDYKGNNTCEKSQAICVMRDIMTLQRSIIKLSHDDLKFPDTMPTAVKQEPVKQ